MESWLFNRMLWLIPLWISLTVHEWAHAWAAWRLGDDTARLEGRLTLNPLVHVDPLGTVVLPLIGVPFGWAKPVPVEPLRFRAGVDMRWGMLLTAIAGPVSNVLLVGLAVGSLGLLHAFVQPLPDELEGLVQLLRILVPLNALLALFNMLPIPPLDGSRIVEGLVPDRLRPTWDAVCAQGPYLLAAVILLPMFMGYHPLVDLARQLQAAVTRFELWAAS